MAWRIAPHIVRGELDNTVKGYITGKLWLLGHPEPLVLKLCGHPEADIAGRRLEFTNPKPTECTELGGLLALQKGVLGELTAARKVKVPAIPVEQLLKSNGKFPYQWSDCFYLEWFSEGNGRVVIESTDFSFTSSEPSWVLTAHDGVAQRRLSSTAWESFMHTLAGAIDSAPAQATDASPANERLKPQGADDEAIEQLLRINELKHEADTLSGGTMKHGNFGTVPLAVEEEFWQHVIDFEKAPQRRRKELLAEDGVPLPSPTGLSDAEITDALWNIIRALARRDMYLELTDHLSDRQLYELLVDKVLEEETADFKPGSGWRNHVSIHDYAREEEFGHIIYLRYYADEKERREWAKDFPEDEIPPHTPAPYDRDRHLPKGE